MPGPLRSGGGCRPSLLPHSRPPTAPSTVCSLQTSCAHSGGTGVSPVVRVMQHQRREGAGEGFFLLLPPLASGGHSKCFWGKKKERKKENQRQSFPVSRNLLPIRALPGASAWFSGANDSSAECFFQGPRWRQTAGFVHSGLCPQKATYQSRCIHNPGCGFLSRGLRRWSRPCHGQDEAAEGLGPGPGFVAHLLWDPGKPFSLAVPQFPHSG